MVMRRIYLIILILGLLACNPGEVPRKISSLPEYVLTAYEENRQLAQTFEYNENDQLILQSCFDEDEQLIRTIQFVYRENGLLDSIYIRQGWFPRKLKFHYEDTLISDWEVWNNGNRFVQQVFIDRDEQGRITKISRMSFDLGDVQTYIFYWEDQNISRYEYAWFGYYDDLLKVHEMQKYDSHINPYYSTFAKIGFHFVDDFPIPLPISKNNTLTEISYLRSNPEKKLVKTSAHFYVGEYPYIRESIAQEGDQIIETYGVFRMKKTNIVAQ
jgi:hypothetical protein